MTVETKRLGMDVVRADNETKVIVQIVGSNGDVLKKYTCGGLLGTLIDIAEQKPDGGGIGSATMITVSEKMDPEIMLGVIEHLIENVEKFTEYLVRRILDEKTS